MSIAVDIEVYLVLNKSLHVNHHIASAHVRCPIIYDCAISFSNDTFLDCSVENITPNKSSAVVLIALRQARRCSEILFPFVHLFNL